MEPQILDEKFENLKREISSVLNKYSQENRSNTPDFILAEYMLGCLTVYENTISMRNNWFTKDVIRTLPDNMDLIPGKKNER